jgi:proton-dependent oligopeptide transporter, POT family
MDAEVVAQAKVDNAQYAFSPVEKELGRGSIDKGRRASIIDSIDEDESENITEEELLTLRRVSGKIPWQAYTLAFVELCERFSYYGSTVVYTNFM